jgi:hypothetical protein
MHLSTLPRIRRAFPVLSTVISCHAL